MQTIIYLVEFAAFWGAAIWIGSVVQGFLDSNSPKEKTIEEKIVDEMERRGR